MQSSYLQTHQALCDVITDKDALFFNDVRPENLEAFFQCAEQHGLANLTYSKLIKHNIALKGLSKSYEAQSLLARAWEAKHCELLATVLNRFAEHNITPLIFKGTALAYSHYEQPIFRERGDSDLLISRQDYELAHRLLLEIGFSTYLIAAGVHNFTERDFVYVDDFSQKHHIDLHVQINAAPFLNTSFSYDVLMASSDLIQIGGVDAHIFSKPDALAIAAYHYHYSLVGSYKKSTESPASLYNLRWVFDMHLLAESFSSADWDKLLIKSQESGLCGSTYSGLKLTQEFFNTAIPKAVLATLLQAGRSGKVDRFLWSSRNVRLCMMAFNQPSLKRKSSYIRDLFFPDKTYIYHQYKDIRPNWLPYLYLRRIFSGVRKRLRLRP